MHAPKNAPLRSLSVDLDLFLLLLLTGGMQELLMLLGACTFPLAAAHAAARPCIANGFIIKGFRALGGTTGRCTWDASAPGAERVSRRFSCRGPAKFPARWSRQ